MYHVDSHMYMWTNISYVDSHDVYMWINNNIDDVMVVISSCGLVPCAELRMAVMGDEGDEDVTAAVVDSHPQLSTWYQTTR